MKYSDFYNVVPSLAKNNSKNIVFVGNNANPQALYNSVQYHFPLIYQSNENDHV